MTRNEAFLCQCCDCANFTPDTIGSGQGVGQCKPYEEYKAKRPGAKALQSAFNRLGGRVFWGGRSDPDRYCERFEAKV